MTVPPPAPAAVATAPAIVRAMAGRRILVVGDVMLDRFVTGDAARLSPEAPVPVLKAGPDRMMAGGAGNVAANLHGLGVVPFICAVTGTDEAGAILARLMAAQGVDCSGLLADAARPTTEKTRFMAGPHHLLRVDREESGPLPDRLAERLVAHAVALMPEMAAVILSDYGKGVLTPMVLAGVTAAAARHGVPVFVDPKGTDYARYGADIFMITPNRKELAEATGSPALRRDDEIVAAAARLDFPWILATRSEDGMTLLRAGAEKVWHIRAEKLPVYDVSGAGDTVIATVAAAVAAGAEPPVAAYIANRAAGIVVSKPGTAAITAAELQDSRQGVTPRAVAAHQIAQWREAGLRVGFTNGCFDILHYGHVTYLAEARERCDRLVVAVNADSSVRRLKGPTRPVNDEAARAAVLAALAAVDMVVLFGDEAADDDKPCALLELLRPAVIFKGGDYREEQLPEARVVRAYGGDVQIMGLRAGHSTTATIARMKDQA